MIPVVTNAFQTWKKYRRYTQTLNNNRRSSNPSVLVSDQIETSEQLSVTMSEQSWSFLDYAKISNQGRFLDRIVNDIKSLRRIIIVFLLLIPYWLLYFQVKTGLNEKLFLFYEENIFSMKYIFI